MKHEYKNIGFRPQGKNESLEHYAHALAKSADDRMRAIEAASRTKHFEHIKEYAYKGASKDIRKYSKEGLLRWNKSMPKNEEMLKNKIADMQRFMENVTSLPSNVKRSYKNRVDTLNERYGTNLSWEDLAKFYEQDYASVIADMYYETETFQAIDIIKKVKKRKNGDDIIQRIKDASDKNIRVSNDMVMDEVVKKILQSGHNIEDLF